MGVNGSVSVSAVTINVVCATLIGVAPWWWVPHPGERSGVGLVAGGPVKENETGPRPEGCYHVGTTSPARGGQVGHQLG